MCHLYLIKSKLKEKKCCRLNVFEGNERVSTYPRVKIAFSVRPVRQAATPSTKVSIPKAA